MAGAKGLIGQPALRCTWKMLKACAPWPDSFCGFCSLRSLGFFHVRVQALAFIMTIGHGCSVRAHCFRWIAPSFMGRHMAPAAGAEAIGQIRISLVGPGLWACMALKGSAPLPLCSE